MTKVSVVNTKGAKIEDIKLNEEIFGIEPNKNVLYDAIILSRASLRQGTHSTKNRSEVSGGGRKPWRQKGTGRARQGSIRAVQWVGGGRYGTPVPRDYSKKQNRKERVLALKSALTSKAQNKELVVLDSVKFDSMKTKDLIKVMEDLKLSGKVMFITVDDNEKLYMAGRNLQNVAYILADEINCYDLINADLVVCDEATVKYIEEVLK